MKRYHIYHGEKNGPALNAITAHSRREVNKAVLDWQQNLAPWQVQWIAVRVEPDLEHDVLRYERDIWGWMQLDMTREIPNG